MEFIRKWSAVMILGSSILGTAFVAHYRIGKLETWAEKMDDRQRQGLIDLEKIRSDVGWIRQIMERRYSEKAASQPFAGAE